MSRSGKQKKNPAPPWENIFRVLRQWRATAAAVPPVGAVEQIAEKFPHHPWAILVATIISLRTKDETTVPVSLAILTAAPSPEQYLTLTENTAQQLAFPAGFYRVKAKNLRRIAEILHTRYGGQVPADAAQLLALPGVGLKTANLTLALAFALPAICVDTHVHRLSHRLGWTQTATPNHTEAALREILPAKFWGEINQLLVLFGQRICRPLSPFCSRCPLDKFCARADVAKSR